MRTHTHTLSVSQTYHTKGSPWIRFSPASCATCRKPHPGRVRRNNCERCLQPRSKAPKGVQELLLGPFRARGEALNCAVLLGVFHARSDNNQTHCRARSQIQRVQKIHASLVFVYNIPCTLRESHLHLKRLHPINPSPHSLSLCMLFPYQPHASQPIPSIRISIPSHRATHS